jgi:hypothetical protein
VDHVDQRVVLAGCGLTTLVYAVGWWVATRRLDLSDDGGPDAAPPLAGQPS